MKKDLFKNLILLGQKGIPYNAIERDSELPVNVGKIITVPGVRRCGKSYKMKLAINRLVESGISKERILWIGFDDERLIPMKTEDLDLIIQAYAEIFPDIDLGDVYMFFDELQLIEGWEYFVLRLYKLYCKNIYVSGSNATMLSTELVSALRGYPREYKTYPLSFSEYCRFKKLDLNPWLEVERAKLVSECRNYINGSAFPEVVLESDRSEKIQLLQTYYNTMLLKDVAEHYKISNVSVLRYFTKRVMGNVTKPTSINSIYNDIKSQGQKVGKNELYDWMDYLCNIFMFIEVPIYNPSFKAENRMFKKYYCIDNGLRHAVYMPLSPDEGKNLENAVLLELVRRIKPFEKVTYFQTSCECDFMIQSEDEIKSLIQVSWTLADKDTRVREIAGLLEASKVTRCKECKIITFDEEETIQAEDLSIQVLPAWKWLLQPIE